MTFGSILVFVVWILNSLVSSGSCTQIIATNSSLSLTEVDPQIECPNPFIEFYLYTRKKTNYQVTTSSVQEAPFVLNAPIKLMVHGFLSTRDSWPQEKLMPEYLKQRDLNVLSVDFRYKAMNYFKAVKQTPLIGKCIGIFLLNLFNARKDLKLENLHVIGFSLGAHVAGHAGRYIKTKSQVIPRITGLDPAGPLYNFTYCGEVLEKSDANFVDVLHTNIGILGQYLQLGHLDFYANSGFMQPGCGFNPLCSHMRSVEYFAESINGKTQFLAVKCSNYNLFKGICSMYNDKQILIVMGEHVDSSQDGVYYFRTNDRAPYAQGRTSYK